MRKTTKLLSVFVLASALGTGVVTGCAHKHTYSAEWSYNQTQHWHAATCGHNDQKSSLSDHEDADGNLICDVCSYDMSTHVTGVTLSETSKTIMAGDSFTLTATVAPEDAHNKALTWETSDGAIATVDQTGRVTAVAKGTATITVKTVDGERSATCSVTVSAREYAVSFNMNGYGTQVESKQTVDGKVTAPDTASDENYIFGGWYSNAACTGEAIDFATQVFTANTELFAKWTRIPMFEKLGVEGYLIKEDFQSQAEGTVLNKFSGTYGESGIYYSNNGTDKDASNYVKVSGGVATQVDDVSASGGVNVETHTIIDFGAVKGDVEFCLTYKIENGGNSWTPIQILGTSDVKTDSEVFGLRVDSGAIKYRLNGGTATDENIVNSVAMDNGVAHEVYVKFNSELKTITIAIDGKAYLTDLPTQISEIIGVKAVSSNTGAKLIHIDDIAVRGQLATLDDVKEKMSARLDSAYAKYTFTDSTDDAGATVPATHSINGAQVTSAYNTAKSAISASTSISEVNTVYKAGIAAMAAVESDATVKAAREAAVTQLTSYKSATDYTLTENKTAYEMAIEQGTNAINTATNSTDIATALTEAKQAVDAVLTDAQVNAAKLAEAKKDAAATLDEYKATEISAVTDETIKGEITTIISDAKAAIEGAESIAEVEELLAEAEGKIDAQLTLASGDIDAIKSIAIAELEAYAEDAKGEVHGTLNEDVKTQISETAQTYIGNVNAIVIDDSAEDQEAEKEAKIQAVKDELANAKTAIDSLINALKANTYNVTYVGAEITGEEVAYGNKVTKPADPTAPTDAVEGSTYKLIGYFADAEYNTAFDFENTCIYEITTIYVKFEEVIQNIQTIGFTTASEAELTKIQNSISGDADYDEYGVLTFVYDDVSKVTLETANGDTHIKYGGALKSTKRYIKIDLSNYSGEALISFTVYSGSAGRSMYLATAAGTSAVSDAMTDSVATVTTAKGTASITDYKLTCGSVYYICTDDTVSLSALTITLDVNDKKA